MRIERSVRVDAPADRVFAVYADVERWPDWTASVTDVQRLDDGPFGVGSRVRVRQPRLPVAVWEVTDLLPGRSFSWVARAPGVVTTATHAVVPVGAESDVTATLHQGGLLGALVGAATKNLAVRYVEQELRGLRSRCEGGG